MATCYDNFPKGVRPTIRIEDWERCALHVRQPGDHGAAGQVQASLPGRKGTVTIDLKADECRRLAEVFAWLADNASVGSE